jgi:hypothetical protein
MQGTDLIREQDALLCFTQQTVGSTNLKARHAGTYGFHSWNMTGLAFCKRGVGVQRDEPHERGVVAGHPLCARQLGLLDRSHAREHRAAARVDVLARVAGPTGALHTGRRAASIAADVVIVHDELTFGTDAGAGRAAGGASSRAAARGKGA